MASTVPLSALALDLELPNVDAVAAAASAAGLAITTDELGRQALSARDARQLITNHRERIEATEASHRANIALQNRTREWEQARNAAVDRAHREVTRRRGNTPDSRQEAREAARTAGARFERDNPVPRHPNGEPNTHLIYTADSPVGLIGRLKEAIR